MYDNSSTNATRCRPLLSTSTRASSPAPPSCSLPSPLLPGCGFAGCVCVCVCVSTRTSVRVVTPLSLTIINNLTIHLSSPSTSRLPESTYLSTHLCTSQRASSFLICAQSALCLTNGPSYACCPRSASSLSTRQSTTFTSHCSMAVGFCALLRTIVRLAYTFYIFASKKRKCVSLYASYLRADTSVTAGHNSTEFSLIRSTCRMR